MARVRRTFSDELRPEAVRLVTGVDGRIWVFTDVIVDVDPRWTLISSGCYDVIANWARRAWY